MIICVLDYDKYIRLNFLQKKSTNDRADILNSYFKSVLCFDALIVILREVCKALECKKR